MIADDEVFDALAHLRRRQLLVRLLHDDPQPVPRLSTASREMLQAHDAFLREYLSGSREIDEADKAAIRTHHVHLPKLVACDYVEWDREANLVTKGPDFDDLRALLEVVDDRRDDGPASDADDPDSIRADPFETGGRDDHPYTARRLYLSQRGPTVVGESFSESTSER